MKKLMFALMLLWSISSAFAHETKGKEGADQYVKVKKALKNTGMCQVTLKAMAGAPGNQIEIKCSYTGYNCLVALMQAMMCLEDLKREVIQ
jgi:hypothetical protein